MVERNQEQACEDAGASRLISIDNMNTEVQLKLIARYSHPSGGRPDVPAPKGPALWETRSIYEK